MEASILKSTKKILGVGADYTAFDLDILTHINSAFGSLHQLGVGPIEGFSVEDESAEWSALGLPIAMLNMVRTYIYLKVRLVFDPPTTSFHLDAVNKQIEQLEWRLGVARDEVVAALNGESA